MATNLRKCVCLPPSGTMFPGSYQDVVYNKPLFLQSGTPWIRIFADWPSLDIRWNPSISDWTGNGAYASALDSQIAQANQAGLNVILCAYRFHTDFNTTNVATYRPYYPSSPAALCFPDDLSTTGPWAAWLNWILYRYHDPSRIHISMLEIVNEPNLQCWPQLGLPGGGSRLPVAACAVYQMFNTAVALNAWYCDASGVPYVLLGGPATSGVAATGNDRTNYLDFTNQLLSMLAPSLDTSRFVWTQHNYEDVQSYTITRVSSVYNALRGSPNWHGWSDGVSSPTVFVTEGGVDPVAAGGTGQQAAALQTQFNALRNNAVGSGAGIGMLTNYGMYPDLHFDTGLLNLPPDCSQTQGQPCVASGGSNGAAREAWGTWVGN